MPDLITLKDTKHVAQLCNLELSDAELKNLNKMFLDTLDYINVLAELDIKDVPPTYQVIGLTNVYQVSEMKKNSLSQEDALSNGDDVREGKFATAAVFDR
jgi:aspartyl-tRNA(Asn)/glutamyl-tRNA(Gln) amidotransferase subunit C